MASGVKSKPSVGKAASSEAKARGRGTKASQRVSEAFAHRVHGQLTAAADGMVVLQIEGMSDEAIEMAIAGFKTRYGFLRLVSPGGRSVDLSAKEDDGLSKESDLQRLVDASNAHDNKLEAIEARMRAKAVEMVMGGTSWLTASELFSERDKKPSNVHTVVSRWLEQGRIFALEKNGVRIYPRYAFDAMVEPVPVLKEVLEVLKGRSPFQIAAWFESTSNFLGGESPRQMLEKDGAGVLMAAYRAVEGPVHG